MPGSAARTCGSFSAPLPRAFADGGSFRQQPGQRRASAAGGRTVEIVPSGLDRG